MQAVHSKGGHLFFWTLDEYLFISSINKVSDATYKLQPTRIRVAVYYKIIYCVGHYFFFRKREREREREEKNKGNNRNAFQNEFIFNCAPLRKKKTSHQNFFDINIETCLLGLKCMVLFSIIIATFTIIIIVVCRFRS